MRTPLRAIVVCAVDTGMRQGELLKLTWDDIDFAAKRVTVRAINSKTLKTRATIGMTPRVERELTHLRSVATDSLVVFGIASNIKRSFGSALKAAGVSDFRFHDLRHTYATRAEQSGQSDAQIRFTLGHSPRSKMTERYINADETTHLRAAAMLTEWQERQNASAAAVN